VPVDALRERASTTPGRLVILASLLLAGAVLFGVIALVADQARSRATRAARVQAEPLLADAVTLYTALADANATATTTFLSGGLEPPARRARYVEDLRLASDALAGLSQRGADSAQVRSATRQITEQIPAYSQLIASARANARQGFPVGAAYLRRASTLLSGTILPDANRLYATEARSLSDHYAVGTSRVPVIVLSVAAVVALVLLIVAQIQLSRITHRVINVPLAAATVLLAVTAIWTLVGLISEESSLATARRNSDAVELLSASQVLVSRAQGDQSLTLANRGSDEIDPKDFQQVMAATSPNGGLLSLVSASGVPPAAVQRLENEFGAYRAQSGQVTGLIDRGQIPQAVAQASSAPAIAAADRLAGDLAGQAGAAQARFAASATSASSDLSGLAFAIPLFTVLAAVLALIGIRQRLEEYR
jgi:hypothetical protein